MKVFIINFNRLTLPAKMADWLYVKGCEPIFVDNNSDYPPLLQYYYNCPYQIFRMKENFGHRVIWESPIFEKYLNERYIVTDSDLDLTGVPEDFLLRLQFGLNVHPEYDKCALSLEINDLPDYPEGRFIAFHEAKYWSNPIDAHFYKADTDTTFALYREGVRTYSHSAIRAMRPYTARHVPWYYKDFESLSEEDKYYFRTANASSSGKIRLMP
jgi:hypothetical protein